MNYRIEFEKAATKFIKKQDAKSQEKLLRLINKLPQGSNIKKLRGFTSHYRLRVNDYRVINVKLDDLYIIKVINVDNRGDVYK